LQPLQHPFALGAEKVDWHPGKEAVPDIEALRDAVEGESDERLVGRFRLSRMLHGSLQQLVPESASLPGGVDEQLGEEPDVVAYPAPGGAEHLAIFLRHPQAVRVILEGKELEAGRACSRHRAKTMPHGEIVDAGDHQRVGFYQIARSGGSVNE